MFTPPLSLALALALGAGPGPAVGAAPTGGTLIGRIVYGGDPPAAARVEVNKDPAVCGPLNLTDRSLRVGDGGGLTDAVVWLDLRASGKDLPDGFTGDDAPPAVTLDNLDCRFEPHVVLLRTGQELRIVNSDPIAHQATAFLNRNVPFNESLPVGDFSVSKRLEKAELVPCPVTCPIHPWMRAHVFVQPHGFMAVTGPDGRFEIAGLPPGEWTFRVWQEKTGFLKSDELKGEPPAGWDGAKLTVTVPAGGTADLGEVVADPAAFE